MSDKNLPDDTRDCDIDPPTCEQCSELEDKIEALKEEAESTKEVLSDALELLLTLETMTRNRDFGAPSEREWRLKLTAAIAECRRLA